MNPDAARALCVCCTRDLPDGAAMCCQRCSRRLRDALTGVSELFCMLPLFMAPGSVRDSSGIRGSKGAAQPSPVNLNAVALTDARSDPTGFMRDGRKVLNDGPAGVLAMVGGWAAMVREERQLAPALAVPRQWFSEWGTLLPAAAIALVARECNFLITHLDWITGQPWVDEMWTEVRDAHRALKKVCGEPKPRKVATCMNLTSGGGPACVECAHDSCRAVRIVACTADLYASAHSDRIVCHDCGRVYPRSDWERLGQAMGVIAS